MAIERSLLDRFLNVAILNKRQIGRPIKYNIRTKGRQGWVEILFNPRSPLEKFVADVMRFVHPYLAFVTYRFHVEKARDAGIRIEDFYFQKFHKEPYFMFHIYAQYFHPETLLERVRDTSFHRRPRTIFKGFTVPDWATAEKRHGWQVDAYSRQAWDNAMADFNNECTPMPFFGERQEPNVIEWFRLEQFGKGLSSRLFYNEVPNIQWHRHNGHLDNPQEALYSFNNANQDSNIVFGIDTTTPEGRAQFKKEYDALHELAPEVVRKEDFQYPHEMGKHISTEPHFQRIWKYYQEHSLIKNIDNAVSNGKVSQSDAAVAKKFLGTKNHHLSASQYVQAKQGLRPDLAKKQEYLTTDQVLNSIGLNKIRLTNKTSEDYESQFWSNLDVTFNLTEIGLKEELPYFVTDPNNRIKVEAIIQGRSDAYLDVEQTKQLSA